ncbi:MAG: transaldolase, partial [Candidatus Omnitrophica bacterium]|nr:transaldolase [Candidatus Omnitrophota bacterium]
SYVATIYKRFREFFSPDAFRLFSEKGANIQRVLWGSTSTKNPVYSDIKYVSELIARDTVNTMPEATYNAFLNHGEVREALTPDCSGAQEVLAQLKEAGIDMEQVCAALLVQGLDAFVGAYEELLVNIEKKANVICRR